MNCGSVEIPALPPLPCAVLFAVPGMPARSFTGPMSAVAEAGMAPSYNVRDTTARDGLIGDSRLNPFPEPHVPVLEKTESSHNTGTWLYASDVSAYGSSAESEGDGQPPSDSERRRWYAGCPNLFLELSRCAPVTGTGQTAHDFNFPIHYRRSQNRDGINRVLDRLISIWILVISL